MDFQNRAGSKPGSGGVAGHSETEVGRRERLRRLALETIDLAKDPYFMKNHLGTYECRLCLTLHTTEGSYLAHTQARKHQMNLGRRAQLDARSSQGPFVGHGAPMGGGPGGFGAGAGVGAGAVPAPGAQAAPAVRRAVIKIGRPGYKVTKVRDPVTHQFGMLLQIHYPQIADGIKPRHRFMSAYQQRIELPSRHFQYLLIAAEPYETIAFKIQSFEIDMGEGRFWTHWDTDTKQFHLQFFFKAERGPAVAAAAMPPN
ncbi:CWF complex protein sap62 [Polyrhizophydium stewartii]|uniref:CWF complex protein sap62 n=1 Tax=Polyrhizophydium stewartii TaxID=2732419 RepID=A0ABR4NIA1_9FUNG|nr:Splicing factor 3A subunit 2 [Polyrhizophydium stewartii]